MKSLNELRLEIDQIDSDLIKLFIKRMNCVKNIAKIKQNQNMPVFNKEREQNVLNNILKLSGNYKYESQALFHFIFDITKEYQNKIISKK